VKTKQGLTNDQKVPTRKVVPKMIDLGWAKNQRCELSLVSFEFLEPKSLERR